MDFILVTLWYILPAGVANLTPPISAKLFKKWTAPADFNKTFRGVRVFGEHKTIRGIMTGTAMAQLCFILQKSLVNSGAIQNIQLAYINALPFCYGLISGAAALFGDLVKSFFKRQLNIPSGKSWFPWDQIDWILGYLAVSIFFIHTTLVFAIVAIILGLILHIATKFIGYRLKIGNTPF